MVDAVQSAIKVQEDNTEKPKQNIQVVFVTRYTSCFELQIKSKNPKVDKKLIIEKAGRIYEIGIDDKFQGEKPIETLRFSLFMGIQYILDEKFLVFAENVAQTCAIQKHDVFEIQSLCFVSFVKSRDLFVGEKGTRLEQQITNIRNLFQEGYYFSYTYDLSLSRQKQAFQADREWRFAWNSYMCKDLIAAKVKPIWTIPVVQGFVSNFQVYMVGKKLDFYLIARRSCKKAGTRYNARGVDDEGNVGNYNEVEQFFIFNQYCCSHLQIRGSVPIFWKQTGITANTQITRTFEFTNGSFLKHFEDVKKNYNFVICVNLMKRGKPSEQLITEGFEAHVKNNNLDHVRYKFFDFHTVCKNEKYENVNPTIREMHKYNQNFLFYAEDLQNKTVIQTQKGIIRTNCLDCLDRTNVFQSKIALDMLVVQLEMLGVNLAEEFGEDPLDHIDKSKKGKCDAFTQKFKEIWANCGDMISKHYTGTGSTHTDVTRDGTRTFAGLIQHGYKTLNRFYMQNFEDDIKQQTIDLVVGQTTDCVNIFNESVENELIKRQNEFCTFSKIKVFTIIWNVSGFECPADLDEGGNFFGFDRSNTPDIVAVGLQEIIQYNVKSFVSVNNESQIRKWNQTITNALNRYDNYILTKSRDLYGMVLLVFSKKSLQNRISKINEDTVKYGYTSYMGAVAIKLYVDDTSINFLNVNLDYSSKSKISSIDDIHKNCYQQEGVPGKKKDEKIINLNFNFLMGDIGFNINLPAQDIVQNIDNFNYLKQGDVSKAEKVLAKLLLQDEFISQKQNSDYLQKYYEPKINFLPTFKYDLSSPNYVQSVAPSWTDRILLWSRQGDNFDVNVYNRREIVYSAHRPVYSSYTLTVKKINQQIRKQIEEQIQAEINQQAQKIEEEENLELQGQK
ncbi:endonuclease/exonuclease/phosphatase family protein (macronuclear) [Tetrahymena thermophila SB210]|uniref:phosphoinositide 5-phosphatase n=1 Tax=Tetrahymena thermophila (strain SB210) TaxID=312017 RepID=Q23FQ8_TETTS|nr:endonuclease/exonuclease/phosphatase family protein [Tetrahymena thermophila SB210]EAR95552.1 endonuclease/exonuclease/phosphatase family protein [Tetrahymena thermophila SB210]|eukprot:XP_001015797.1 endonuclease/exonuclease/phosphatase family protein [Tetrahymena thermophila SB210]